MNHPSEHSQLRRDVGVWGAVFLGLGSILGSGVFVSLSLAAGSTGPAIVLAVLVAALVAACNGLSSAQLAANHPVSGGTYEYGHRFLTPRLGFIAGWLFVCAKSASAATAALGLAGYALQMLGHGSGGGKLPLAMAAVALLTVLVLAGARRTSLVNTLIVLFTLTALSALVVACVPSAIAQEAHTFTPFFRGEGPLNASRGFLEACALMFVAYTGYGRIATMGEEITEPQRNIPRAIMITLFVSLVIYAAVALSAVTTVGASDFAAAGIQSAAPLEYVAGHSAWPHVSKLVAIGAITAMLGVLLNLILGLSRVVMAMGRRGDLPPMFARIDNRGRAPVAAVVLTAIVIGGLACLGNVKATWSFSAFTVLTYYALTNLAALRLDRGQRLYPRLLMWLGFFACLFLAFWVEPIYWMVGLGVMVAGLAWREVYRWASRGEAE
jgi:basic amino acid/polyamine antiporter, APA family